MSSRAAFQSPPFRRFQAARFASVLAVQASGVAVGWQIYDLTRRPLDLGWVGLAQFLPVLLLFPVTGAVADRYPRQRVVQVTTIVSFLSSVALARADSVAEIYGALVVLGVARALGQPASNALVPSLVPLRDFPNAVTWGSTLFHVGQLVGPALGGLVYGASGSARAVYVFAAALQLGAALAIGTVRPLRAPAAAGRPGWGQVLDGVRYVRAHKVLLGAITLDLFAVLLGGAVALLPIYASDVLHVGPMGLGALRAAPAIGAMGTAAIMLTRPVGGRAGRKMFAAVAVFGLATCLFAVSTNLALSLFALAVVGASDELSVLIRQTILQVATPEEMRGRVSAVNFVFVGMSNELGELESGALAQVAGARLAALIGGIGTLVVVGVWGWWAKELREVDELTGR